MAPERGIRHNQTPIFASSRGSLEAKLIWVRGYPYSSCFFASQVRCTVLGQDFFPDCCFHAAKRRSPETRDKKKRRQQTKGWRLSLSVTFSIPSPQYSEKYCSAGFKNIFLRTPATTFAGFTGASSPTNIKNENRKKKETRIDKNNPFFVQNALEDFRPVSG